MGLHLKILRKKLGITLESLAASSGMTKSYLSKVERGLNTPSIAAALKIAKALNVNVEYLFSDATSPTEAYSLIRENQRKLVPSSAKATSYALLAHPAHDRNLLPLSFSPHHSSAIQPSRNMWERSSCLSMKGASKSIL